jgi:hypothetical protein
VLREGPIPAVVHGVLEYAVGVLLIAAPFLFGFDSSAATGVSVALGVVLLALAAASRMPTGLVDQISSGVHVTVDMALVLVLIGAPFVLGFRDEAAPRNLFLVLGVAHLLVTIGTSFRGRDRAEDEAS